MKWLFRSRAQDQTGVGGSDALRRLRVGDAVEYDGRTWTVRGRLEFNEVGVRWTEFVVDPDRRIWLTVDGGDSDEVSWWNGIPASDVEQGGSGDDLVVVGGARFRLQHRGTAAYSGRGETGVAAAGSCDYADYRTVDRWLLGFENYGTAWKVAAGRLLQPADVVVRPARRS